MTVAELQDLTHDLEAGVSTLEIEQASLRRRIGEAVAAFDTAGVAHCRRRLEALPGEILAAKIEYQRKRLDLANARKAEDQERLAALMDEVRPVTEQIERLRASVAQQNAMISGLRHQIDTEHRHRPMTERQKLERLMEQQVAMLTDEAMAAGAPVMHSLW